MKKNIFHLRRAPSVKIPNSLIRSKPNIWAQFPLQKFIKYHLRKFFRLLIIKNSLKRLMRLSQNKTFMLEATLRAPKILKDILSSLMEPNLFSRSILLEKFGTCLRISKIKQVFLSKKPFSQVAKIQIQVSASTLALMIAIILSPLFLTRSFLIIMAIKRKTFIIAIWITTSSTLLLFPNKKQN